MRKFSLAVLMAAMLAVLTLGAGVYSGEPDKVSAAKVLDVPQYLQDISVTIRASSGGNGAEGSGVFKVTKDGQVWVWTCGHLIQHIREIRKSDDGKSRVEFHDAKIIKVLTEDGRKVAEMNFDAEVIRYSDATHGDDLALLRLRSKQYKPASSTKFYLDAKIPPIGTKLLHCGSLLGQMGSTSVTNGIVSQQGRVFLNNVIFDQTNAACFPGSSGGIICLEDDGRYVGMLVRGAGETFGLYVPVRRIRTWAKKVGVEFALDDTLPVPTDDELHKKPVDDGTATGTGSHSSNGDGEDANAYPTKLFLRTKVMNIPAQELKFMFGN